MPERDPRNRHRTNGPTPQSEAHSVSLASRRSSPPASPRSGAMIAPCRICLPTFRLATGSAPGPEARRPRAKTFPMLGIRFSVCLPASATWSFSRKGECEVCGRDMPLHPRSTSLVHSFTQLRSSWIDSRPCQGRFPLPPKSRFICFPQYRCRAQSRRRGGTPSFTTPEIARSRRRARRQVQPDIGTAIYLAR